MPTIKELIEKRVGLHEQNKAALAVKDGVPTPEVLAACRARNTEMSTLQETIDLMALAEADERSLAESRGRQTDSRLGSDVPGDGPSREEIDLAFRGWALGRHAGVHHRDAAAKINLRMDCPSMQFSARKYVDDNGHARIDARAYLGGAESDLRVTGSELRAINGPEKRTLSSTTTGGGYSIPNELMRTLYEYRKYFGPMRQAADEVQTDTGATLPWPTVDDTSNTGEIIGESSAVTTTADPSFGIVNLAAYKFSSKAVIVPVELLQDSNTNIPQLLGRLLGTRIGRINNTKFTTGAGTTEPAGLITRSAAGATAAVSTAFIFDDIFTLVHSVDPAYRPFCSFMLHDSIALVVRQMKDGFGRYLWEPSTQVGQPDRLLGFPVYINNDMDSALTTGKKLICFGLFKNYLIRDAGPLLLLRADELKILNHQVVFLAMQRSDGNLIDTTSSKYLALA
jgi:HK97 family phage major capsid protein